MAKEIMRRQAADNPYLHPDFHGALSAGLEYLHDRYGEDAVREYLRAFAKAFYAPLKDELRRRGLAALEDHFRRIYSLEGGQIRLVRSEDELRLDVEACPAVTHMRMHGYPVARLFTRFRKTRIIFPEQPHDKGIISIPVNQSNRRRHFIYRHSISDKKLNLIDYFLHRILKWHG